MAAVATIQIMGTGYPSFGDVDAADLYFAASTKAATWGALADKGMRLVSSSRILTRQAYKSTPVDVATPQPLAFPRVGIVVDGVTIPDTDVPDRICEANFELAFLLNPGANPETVAVTGSAETKRTLRKIDVITTETEFFAPAERGELIERFPYPVQELLDPFLAGADLDLAAAFGTDHVSLFLDACRWNVTGFGKT